MAGNSLILALPARSAHPVSGEAAPRADARALVLHVVFSGVVDIAPAERRGVEAGFIRGGGDIRRDK